MGAPRATCERPESWTRWGGLRFLHHAVAAAGREGRAAPSSRKPTAMMGAPRMNRSTVTAALAPLVVSFSWLRDAAISDRERGSGRRGACSTVPRPCVALGGPGMGNVNWFLLLNDQAYCLSHPSICSLPDSTPISSSLATDSPGFNMRVMPSCRSVERPLGVRFAGSRPTTYAFWPIIFH